MHPPEAFYLHIVNRERRQLLLSGIAVIDPSEYARLSPGSQNYKKKFFLRTRSYRTMAATWGDCTIPSDQLTLRINGSG
jgi:hypothetical protein